MCACAHVRALLLLLLQVGTLLCLISIVTQIVVTYLTPPPQPEQGQSFSDIDVRAQKHGCNDISRVLSAVWPAASAAWRVRRGALSLWPSARTLRSAVHGG